MKKQISLGFFALMIASILCLFLSCSATSKPGKAAQHYINSLYEKNYDQFLEGQAFVDDTIPGRRDENIKTLRSMLEEKGAQAFPSIDSVENTRILSEKIHKNGETAEVQLITSFKNGTKDTNTYNMIKREGVWKIYNEK